MATTPFSMLDEIEEQALAQCMWISTEMITEMMGSDGRVYGDVLPDRADRIARFLDLAERGVLDVLATISPPTYDMLLRDYIHDIEASELIRSA